MTNIEQGTEQGVRRRVGSETPAGSGEGVRPLGGVLLLTSGLMTFAVEFIAIARSSAPFSFAEQAVSDLGAVTCGPLDTYDPPIEVCSPAHDLVNLTWIATGVLIAVGMVLLRPRGAGGVGVAATVLLVVAGVLQAGVGLTPVDIALEAHLLVALVGFVCQAVGLPLLGVAWRRRPATRALGGVILLLGAITIAAAVLLVLATVGVPLPLGIVERGVLYPFQVWMLVTGVWALTSSRVADSRGADRGD